MHPKVVPKTIEHTLSSKPLAIQLTLLLAATLGLVLPAICQAIPSRSPRYTENVVAVRRVSTRNMLQAVYTSIVTVAVVYFLFVCFTFFLRPYYLLLSLCLFRSLFICFINFFSCNLKLICIFFKSSLFFSGIFLGWYGNNNNNNDAKNDKNNIITMLLSCYC